MKSRKLFAEINGRDWDVSWPFCSGCPELVISGHCLWEGNGCRYPEERMKRPINYARAFFRIADNMKKSYETLCDELGDCLLINDKTEGE